jgi:hypothetical protein
MAIPTARIDAAAVEALDEAEAAARQEAEGRLKAEAEALSAANARAACNKETDNALDPLSQPNDEAVDA